MHVYTSWADDIDIPTAADCSNSFEAAWSELVGAGVATIHCPVE